MKLRLPTLKPTVRMAPSRVPVMQPGSWRTNGQTSAQRGYGYKWQKARSEYLAKHPYCVYCLREAGIRATGVAEVTIECAEHGLPVPYASVVDHKVPHRGDRALFWDRSNWQSLCSTHHSQDKQREEAHSR